ncbi:hypothetical protein [Streptomyces sp. NPDC002491]
MTGVVAYIVLVTVITAITCCHHGEDGRAVGRATLRNLRRPSWALSPNRARRYARNLSRKGIR